MRYLICFRYDGTKFHGFQRQNTVKNVQGCIERALSLVLRQNIIIKGSGRTDAGVHANMQCAHFDYDGIVNRKVIKLVNDKLNNDVIIYRVKRVNDNFHARYSVKKKRYIYKVNVGKFRSDYVGYYYQIKCDLDIDCMVRVAKVLEGKHDYRNFVSGYRDDYVSTIYRVKFKKRHDILEFYFEGIGFYRYMVRHLVGALLDAGKGKIDDVVVKDMFLGKVNKSSSVVPADGLYLDKIWFF